MINEQGSFLYLIYLMLDVAFKVLSAILIISVISFAIEPLHPIYQFISRAEYSDIDDKKYLLKHCTRIFIAMMVIVLIKTSHVAEYIMVLLERVTQ